MRATLSAAATRSGWRNEDEFRQCFDQKGNKQIYLLRYHRRPSGRPR